MSTESPRRHSGKRTQEESEPPASNSCQLGGLPHQPRESDELCVRFTRVARRKSHSCTLSHQATNRINDSWLCVWERPPNEVCNSHSALRIAADHWSNRRAVSMYRRLLVDTAETPFLHAVARG